MDNTGVVTSLPLTQPDLRGRIALWLQSSRVAPFIIAFALVMSLPSLWSGRVADDYYHAARFLAPTLLPDVDPYSPFGLFSVSDGGAGTNRALVAQGLLPWWTAEEFSFRLWRPLAEATHWLDYRLWPDAPWLMHLHHLGWFAALLWMAWRFYRRLFPDHSFAVLALAVFALSPNLCQTVTWLSARNTLLGATLGIAALLLHFRASRQGRLRDYGLAWGMFALALLASEFGLGASVWLFAWVMVMESGRLWQKCLRLLPYGIVMAGWAALYMSGGYGVAASEFYQDPLRHPAGYAMALLQRGVDLLAGAFYGVPPSMVGLRPDTLWGWLAIAGLITIAASLIHPQLRDRRFRFLLLGALLSLLPIAAGPGGPRTLAFVSLGMAPFAATLLQDWLQRSRDGRLFRFTTWFLLLGLALGPLARPATAYTMATFNARQVQAPIHQLAAAGDARTLILLNPASSLQAILFPLARVEAGLPGVPQQFALASGRHPIRLIREDDHSLRLAPEEGFLGEKAAYFVRREQDILHPGEQLTFDGMTVEVLALNAEQRPADVRFRFALPLDSPALLIMHCELGQYRPFKLPAVGKAVVVQPCRR